MTKVMIAGFTDLTSIRGRGLVRRPPLYSDFLHELPELCDRDIGEAGDDDVRPLQF